jgi:RNA polymerase sigma factor (sigma-70 family)
MPNDLDVLLRAFQEGQGEQAWPDFLDRCGGALLQVARSIARDEDEAADAFVFVCERLAANRFARLQKFDPTGPATALTWLRAVTRNLCLDHRRSIRGRFRVFESIARLPLVDQLVFRRRYRDRLTVAETFAVLGPEIPGLTLDGVVAADRRVSVSLSSSQVWALTASRPHLESLTVSDDPEAPAPLEPAATDLNPEALLASAQLRDRVRAAIAALPPNDRLMVRLRLEQDLTLAELARVCGLRDAQHADRRLRGIYRTLRQQLE